ncbi:MAG TPA: helix-turn-helix transcriptional regulator [Blastocatellia bacterium]|nr:helix-turn-helix transcriptional regulator [Blastocatellia bacterium]
MQTRLDEHAAASTPERVKGIGGRRMERALVAGQTPLSIFVRARLAELGIRQAEFCRQTGFDQGLLSKIHNSMVSNLSLESVLRLALGLNVSPKDILELIDRLDLHELMVRSTPQDLGAAAGLDGAELPAPVLEVCKMALRAHQMGRNLTPVIRVLQPLAAGPSLYMGGQAAGKS